MLGRTAVMDAVYERIACIGSSQKGETYIHRRRKIKEKSESRQRWPLNKMIVARTQRSQFRNCAETTLARLLSLDNRRSEWVMPGSTVIGRIYKRYISKLLASFGKALVGIATSWEDAMANGGSKLAIACS